MAREDKEIPDDDTSKNKKPDDGADKPSKKKSGSKYIETNPPDDEEPMTVENVTYDQSKVDYAIRLGLGDPDKIYFFRRAMLDPDAGVRDPVLRPYAANVLRQSLDLIFNDPQIWNRVRTLLQRKNPNQTVAARVSEAAYRSLEKRAARTGVPMDIVMEAFARGFAEGGEDSGFRRVDSLLDGGRKALERDWDLVTEMEEHPYKITAHMTKGPFGSTRHRKIEIHTKMRVMGQRSKFPDGTIRGGHPYPEHIKKLASSHPDVVRAKKEGWRHEHSSGEWVNEDYNPLLPKIRRALGRR